MKRKTRKRGNNRASGKARSKNPRSEIHAKKRPRVVKRLGNGRRKKSSRKFAPVRREHVVGLNKPKQSTDPRVARALALVRGGMSASVAARREKMKLNTFRRGAGKYLYRSGPGKPWKARSQDQLAFSMTVITSRGPVTAIVQSLRERKLLGQYDSALRMFRAGEDGAEAALKAFEGISVGGHLLITDGALLVQLEEANQLDYDEFYISLGAGS